MRTRLGIIVVLLILFLAIIAQNTQDVTIQAYFWSVTLPSFAVFGSALCVGLIIGVLLGRPWRRSKKGPGPAQATRRPAAPARPTKKDDA